jgi:sugar phosphate permease
MKAVADSVTPARSLVSIMPGLRWLIVVVPFLMWFFGTGEKLNVGVVIADNVFLQQTGLAQNHAALGGLTSWFLIGYGISALPWGFVIEKIGSRTSAFMAASLCGIAMIWFGLAHSIIEFYCSRFVLGLAEGILHPLSNALIARWFPFNERGRATSVWWCATGFGSALLTPTFAVLVVALGWRASFVGYGVVVTVILLPLIVLLVGDDPARKRWMGKVELDMIKAGQVLPAAVQRQIEATNTATTKGSSRNPVFWTNALCNLANSQIHWGTLTWGIAYLVAVRHISLLHSGIFVGGGFALSILLTLFIGYGSDRWQRRAPFGMALYTLIFLALVVALVSTNAIVSAVSLAIGIGATQSGGAVYQTMLHSFLPPQTIARGTGMQAFVINVLAAVSPFLVGVLIGTHENWTAGFIWLLFWPIVAFCTMIQCNRWGL